MGDLEADNSDNRAEDKNSIDTSASVESVSKTDQVDGKPGSDPEKNGLMHSVLEGDKNAIELGNLVLDHMNNGGSFFTPDLIMSKFTSDFRSAKKLFGETMIRQLTGYDANYIENNLRIPEFKRLLEERVRQNIDGLQQLGLIKKDGSLTDTAYELASLVLVMQELDELSAKGVIGERVHHKKSLYGSKEESVLFKKDPYKNINIHQTIRTAIRRGHKEIIPSDLRAFRRHAKGGSEIIYAIDTSGSMKGPKIAQAKKAGIALAYKAILEGDKVGLVAFTKKIECSIPPTKDFKLLAKNITKLRASSETDICLAVEHCIKLFTSSDDKKHIILLTDAASTIGKNPVDELTAAIYKARALGIFVSIVGIALDDEGVEVAKNIALAGEGRFLLASNINELDKIILTEYNKIIS